MQCSFSTAEAVLEAYYISSCDYLADVSSCHTNTATVFYLSVHRGIDEPLDSNHLVQWGVMSLVIEIITLILQL
jgi:hypothetical protein